MRLSGKLLFVFLSSVLAVCLRPGDTRAEPACELELILAAIAGG